VKAEFQKWSFGAMFCFFNQVVGGRPLANPYKSVKNPYVLLYFQEESLYFTIFSGRIIIELEYN
jgi:hypothetical protein